MAARSAQHPWNQPFSPKSPDPSQGRRPPNLDLVDMMSLFQEDKPPLREVYHRYFKEGDRDPLTVLPLTNDRKPATMVE
jgi:hypothetical protein